MRFSKTSLDGPMLVDPDVFRDDRGFFKEAYSERKYREGGIAETFVQDNVSYSHRNVLRGMHYDMRMAKLVQCIEGEIFDAIVDMREGSPTFKQWEGYVLSSENHRQFYIPAGFAHGFYVTSNFAIVSYKQSALYDRNLERAIRWNDPSVGIEWPLIGEPLLSEKDAAC